MKKYLYVFITNIKEAFMWRENLFIWIVINALTYAVYPFIFIAIYGNREELGGYTRAMLVTYFILMPLIDSLTLSYVWDDMGKHVREGTIGQYLAKPMSYLAFMFFSEAGSRVVRFLLSLLIVAIVIPFARHFIVLPHLSLPRFFLFLASLAFGVGLGFLTASALGLISFWTTRSDWALHSWWALSAFAAGYVAPTTLYPPTFQIVISYLPYSLLIETPIRILLDTITTPEVIHRFLVGAIWLGLLGGLNAYIWRRGVRRVDIVGI